MMKINHQINHQINQFNFVYCCLLLLVVVDGESISGGSSDGQANSVASGAITFTRRDRIEPLVESGRQ